MILTHEQPHSACLALRDAGLRHGDTQRVQIAVGTFPSPLPHSSHLAFCSATMRKGARIQKGSWRTRHRRISGDIEFTNAGAVADRIAGRVGFMEGIVHTNGHVTFTIETNSIRVVPVTPDQLCLLQSPCGRRLSRNVLAQAPA